mmetsp:Transcript_63334/g.204126  ORF Transcript_63334/g.204126 Transcript_63334/m.204126 type:complete len:236 (+) Transcript_63334:2-709(+)
MKVVMHRLCRLCLKQQAYAEREVIFCAGEEATKMFFVKVGTLRYTMMDGTRHEPPPQANDWIGEPALWTDWRHQGELMSVTTSELVCVDPGEFLGVMYVHPRPWFYAQRYATRFIELLNSIDGKLLTDLIHDEAFFAQVTQDSDHACEDAAESSRQEGRAGLSPVRFSAASRDSHEPPSGEPAQLGKEPTPLTPPSRGRSASSQHPAAARRVLGLCPGATLLSCGPWCGDGAGQR